MNVLSESLSFLTNIVPVFCRPGCPGLSATTAHVANNTFVPAFRAGLRFMLSVVRPGITKLLGFFIPAHKQSITLFVCLFVNCVDSAIFLIS